MREGTAGDGVVRELGSADVGDGWTRQSVASGASSDVGLTVDVIGTAGIVAWHDNVERGNALGVRELDSSQGSSVDQGQIVGVSVARIVEHASINTLRIGISNAAGSTMGGVLTVELQLQKSTATSFNGLQPVTSTT